MKKVVKIIACLIAVVSLQAIVAAQTGYSITDSGNDIPPGQQRFFSFDINTGNAVEISSLGNNPINYEGFASIGSVLYAFGEPDTVFPSELRIFGPERPQGLYVGATGVTEAQGNETGLAYNAFDGFLYGITSNDNFPATGARSFLWRISPSTGAATLVAPIARAATGTIGDAFPYLDGLAILPNGSAFASECRFSDLDADPSTGNGGLYSLSLATGAATFRGAFVNTATPSNTIQCRQNTPTARDTGLANNGNQLYLLIEDGRIYQVTPGGLNATQVNAVTFRSQINVGGNAINGDFEGFDIPTPVAR